MGSFRSKEDDVLKISTSIFVTNFPDSFSAKDLFHSCKQYGHVVDSFIPTKRTKDVERVLETLFDQPDDQKGQTLEDPIGLYPLLNKEISRIGTKGQRRNEEIDNSFVNLEDVISVGIDLMIVVVYAPQEAKEKRMLWDYLAHVSNQWVGKLVMMGDFNEVRYKSDRYGSNFNAHDAEIFNSFIYNAGLDEVPLGGSAYTWYDYVLFLSNSILLAGSLMVLTRRLGIFGSWPPVNKKNHQKLHVLRLGDEVIDKGDCSNEVVHKRTKILNKIHQVNNIQASEIAQKTKIKWAIEGDENVKFFHACIDTPFPVSLSIDQKEDMERRISKEEVKRAVWDCGVDKSPGPDGFSFSFYRHFWPVIEKDVFEAVDYFFMYGEIPNGCNSNFIALIPKILDANMVKDFRPISLIGSLYKIIAKILANQLVGVLGDLVNEVQSAFVADRQILDGPFILDDVLQW
ncbi:RNA-directed DNA polymerase, eukaryota [Tanacetum coccineum]